MKRNNQTAILDSKKESEEVKEMLNFALSLINQRERKESKPESIRFGGLVELDSKCKCGASIIIELYTDGTFRCIECGIKR